MKLHEAIKAALNEISTDGTTLSPAAIEHLDTLECFDRRPELRFIVSTAVRSGAFSRFARYGEGTEQSHKFLEHFVAHTGFRPELAAEAFTAYASAIGWSDRHLPLALSPSQNAPESNIPAAAEPEESYDQPEQTDWHKLTTAEKISHLNKSLTLDTNKSTTFGATVENPRVVNIDVTGIIITATIRRLTPMGGCQLRYALYDAADQLITVGEAAQMSVFSTDRLPIQFTIPASAIPTDDIIPNHIHLFIN